MSLTGIRDVDIEILLNLDDSELPRVCAVNKYVNSICEHDDFWYRRIINKIGKVKEDNFSKVKNLANIEITGKRVREMQKYFGFDKLKEFNNFLNKLPLNALYPEYMVFDKNDDYINIVYGMNIHTHVFPKYINKEELIYDVRRSFTISRYEPISKGNEFRIASFLFGLVPVKRLISITDENFKTFQNLEIF